MSELQAWAQIVGLSLDIFGVIGLFFFGLPPDFDRHGQSAIIWQEENEEEKKKGRLFAWLSRISLGLLVIGFAMQIIAIALYL